MKYKAFCNYGVADSAGVWISDVREITVAKFEVTGGASRQIDLRSADDIGITSELEQARAHKNVTVFLPSSNGHKNVKAALDLSHYAQKQIRFAFSLIIERYQGNTMLEALALLDSDAGVVIAPVQIGKEFLVADISLPTAEIYSGKMKKDRRGLVGGSVKKM